LRFHNRNHQTFRGIHRNTDVVVFLENDLLVLVIERRVEIGMFNEPGYSGLNDKRKDVNLIPLFSAFAFSFDLRAHRSVTSASSIVVT